MAFCGDADEDLALETCCGIRMKMNKRLLRQNHWYNPAVPLLGICLREMKAFTHTKTCMRMFIAAWFTNRKQLECPSMSRWLEKLCHLHIIGYHHFVIKRSKIPIPGTTWMNLRCIILHGRSQTQKATYCTSSFIWHSRKRKTTRRENSSGFQKLEGRLGWQTCTVSSWLWCCVPLQDVGQVLWGCCLGHPHAMLECGFKSRLLSFCSCVLGGPGAWAPAACVGDPDGGLGSLLWPGPSRNLSLSLFSLS